MPPSTAPAHQVALFKSAARDYLNLGTLKTPYLVSYYIDETFHTTWVVRGRTKFKKLKGEDGLKFSISDHQFTLPKVEAVLISELPEYFKIIGPGVDIILGRDFLTAYSFLFFKRTSGSLQLSRSCINRCKWPDSSERSLDFYTAWHINETGKTKAGISAFVNICSPFTTWRPYKPCYWDPEEDIGLCAMMQAMKTATQMPALDSGPVINIITDDQYAYETYSPFLKIQHRDLNGSRYFHVLSPPLRKTVSRFLEYRETYANRNSLNELSCVRMINFRKQDYREQYASEKLDYAVQLAKLGAKMLEFDNKDQLVPQLHTEHYYHFDTETQVFAAPKKEVNKTLREILESYLQLDDTVPAILSEYAPSDNEPPVDGATEEKTPIPNSNITSEKNHSIPAPIAVPNVDMDATYPKKAAPANDPTEDKSTSTFVPNMQQHEKHRHLVDSTLEEELRKMHQHGLSFPGLYSILDRLTGKDVTLNEKAAILNETTTQLQDLIKQSEEKGLAITECQRRNCDIIMAGARKQQEDLAIGAALAAKHFKGVVEGYFIYASQQATSQATQGVVRPVDLTPIGPLPNGHTSSDPINTHEGTTSADAQKRLEKHLLAVEKLKQSGKLSSISVLGHKIVAIDCQFTTPSKGEVLGRFRKPKKNVEKLKMKAAKSKLDSVEAELAARFSAIDLKFRDNRSWDSGPGMSKPSKPATTRVLGGAVWPSKTGRGQLLEREPSIIAVKYQGTHNRMGSYSNLAARPNMISKDIASERKWPTQTNPQVDTRKTPTTETVGSNANGLSHKNPARYPGGAISLANVSGTPGNRFEDDRRHDGLIGKGRNSSFGEVYTPWSAVGPKQPIQIPGSRKLDSKESVTNPTAPQRTINGIPSTYGMPTSPTSDEKRSRIAHGITPKQLAEMTELSPGGVQRSLNKSIGTLIDALVASPELRKTTIAAVNDVMGECFLDEDDLIDHLGLTEDQQAVVSTA
ncbi:hypothetical protein Q9L58_007240 [Maublancomyces gigas]|uniref:Uncharacterized protein n=1 Tax=Discina gigas TaxID=1032678 RepID=A0ABR3GDK7_9PEZI